MSKEAKLRQVFGALGLVHLPDYLQANLPTTGKKEELISRIIASPAAFGPPAPNNPAPAPVETAPSGGDDDLFKPPEEFDWNLVATSAETEGTGTSVASYAPAGGPTPLTGKPLSPRKPTSASKATPISTPAPVPPSSTPASVPAAGMNKPGAEPSKPVEPVPLDPEEAKKKARAERFGVPYVPPKAAKPTQPVTQADEVKKVARAARFGSANAATAKPTRTLDPAEEDKKRKRAERFGTQLTEAPVEKKAKTTS
ncbi:uncharacterized protein EI90DRAFT_3157362 [Cantharellus anzutake]|uniref:uncharacterized protein n=1 Tax=Cantharellus anzutake TaxID=1750568 RepID=UPI00190650F5|nr:uncharacterized protein EI90DRAFT_3157362 [Cantharellus anzutake]KAF8324451.1 hypothetical protein EI90DRAFT_3157362 [Cantharellus anzutake]